MVNVSEGMTLTLTNFQMKLFTSIAAAAAVIGTSFLASTPANARSGECFETVNRDTVCILAVYGDKVSAYHKHVKSSVNGYVSWDRVYCNPSHRANYRVNMVGKACFEYN